MIELVIVYCLSTDAQSCVEKRLPAEDFATPAACTMGAQMRAQQYLAAHPKYELKTFRCEVDLPRQAPT